MAEASYHRPRGRAVPVTDGLLLHYVSILSGAVAATGSWQDYGSKGFNATLVDDAYVDASTGLYLDKVVDHADIGDVALDFGSGGLTICAWERSTPSLSTNQQIFHRQDDDNSHNPIISLSLDSGQYFQAVVRGQTNTANLVNITGSTDIRDGGWHWVCVVFDDANDTAEIFVDNNSDGSQSGRTTTDVNFGSAKISLGRSWQGWLSKAGNWFIGDLDDIRVYNRPITTAERGQIFAWNRGQ